jgi:hypothetical protein
LNDEIIVTVIATGFDQKAALEEKKENRTDSSILFGDDDSDDGDVPNFLRKRVF